MLLTIKFKDGVFNSQKPSRFIRNVLMDYYKFEGNLEDFKAYLFNSYGAYEVEYAHILESCSNFDFLVFLQKKEVIEVLSFD